MSNTPTILQQLATVIEGRRASRPTGSYTTTLFEGGVEAIGAKVVEEAGELVEAAEAYDGEDRAAVIHETADLIYHLLVMMAQCDISLSDIEVELARRFGTSGLREKASRKKG